MRGSRARALLPLLLLAVAGCRGEVSSSPPIHLNPNMDRQERYRWQAENPFYGDRRAMRPPVPGTVAVGALRADDHRFRGEDAQGKPARGLPPGIALDRRLLRRGRARFDIYCAPCHGRAGLGDGIVVKRGMLPPPSFHEQRIRALPLGQIFKVIGAGVRNMKPYAAQVAVDDRWAIAAYVRALQLARAAGVEQVPRDIAATKGWSK